MTERQWELYRQSVVEKMPDSEYKRAVLDSIAYKLSQLQYLQTYSSRRRRRTDALPAS